MSTPETDRPDDEQIASLLRAAEHDAPPPDRAVLDRLREQSTAAFQASFAQAANRGKRRRLMVHFVRGLAAAVFVVGIASYFVRLHLAQPTLREVLQRSSEHDVDLLIGDALWSVRKGQGFRTDYGNGRYQFGNDTQVWFVDEKANQVKVQPQSALFIQQEELGLLRLLGVPELSELLTDLDVRPTGHGNVRGYDCLLYQVEDPRLRASGPAAPIRNDSKVGVRIYVHPTTKRLVECQVYRDHRGKGNIAGLTVLSTVEPIPPEKFQIKDSLTEDGRVGKVVDVQGIVSIKPVMANRWTPVQNGMLLKPGDWVRTDPRGANAVALKLMKATPVIVGPGAIVEIVMPDQLRVLEGELELDVPEKAKVEVTGPDGQKLTVTGKKHYRVDGQKLALVPMEPPWLKGFKGALAGANESIGSLIAKVEGRDTPLTVGYHKVTVDIRDQIARTVVEESFVNHTKETLEGVFYFPLPQDASISGFGMWIGNELVEADIVEKQRAREIYEIILREKRDPGLLEWTGGNIFKARVYPIFPHSEKRIKITYTQVLPLKGSRYRYSYALQSELLKLHPLRELAIDVKINSAVPLAAVTCPTHPTRQDKTQHSAHVEFAAQEYTPTRDFEVVVDVDRAQQNEVVMIPHRRGDDGYFMLQLLPPAGNGNWERELLPDGEPVNLLILVDTSASMDQGQRLVQNAFLGALFASLTPKDTINLAACDVNCDWAFEKPVAADAKNLAAARDFLARRVSLGWTDLDKAFASAFQQAGPKTHVLYLGDGIVTARDADPQAFVKRLQQLYDKQPLTPDPSPRSGERGEPNPSPPVGERGRGEGSPTCHAIALGSSFEPAVLKAIGSLGGGSLRRVTGEQGPAAVAREFLAEISTPSLRDLRVEFKGLRTARVYPDVLPNLPAGTQQILLGRYLPEGVAERDQTGEVIVTGYQNGKPLRFTAKVSLKDAEQGNSFIPRLWARMHLDRLLEQGQSETIKDEIIALSEEYNIITPYTSFLVLESDADRERFRVKRRFRMRDGEKFFAEGRDTANYELVQQQMKRAGAWRLGLRANVLRSLAGLGREANAFRRQDLSELMYPNGRMPGLGGRSDYHLGTPVSMTSLGRFSDSLDNVIVGLTPTGGFTSELDLTVAPDDVLREKWLGEGSGSGPGKMTNREVDTDEDFKAVWLDIQKDRTGSLVFAGEELDLLDENAAFGAFPVSGKRFSRGTTWADSYAYPASSPAAYFRRRWDDSYTHWVNTLFPPLPPAPAKPKERKSTWPAEAQALAKSLLRTEQLAQLQGGLDIRRTTQSFDTRWQEVTSESRKRELYSPKSWATRSQSDWNQNVTHWCDGKEYGVLGHAFGLGRLRAAVPEDLRPPLELYDHSLDSLEFAYAGYTPTLKEAGKDRTLLVLTHPQQKKHEVRILIDTARRVLLSIETVQDGKTAHTQRWDDFIEVAGSWWAQRLESFDAKNQRTSLTTQIIKLLPAEEFTKEFAGELARRSSVQFLRSPLPKLDAAKQSLAAHKASFDDHYTLLLHFLRTQQWTRVFEHLEQLEKLAADKPGVRWLRPSLCSVARRHEEMQKLILAEIPKTLALSPAEQDLFLAQHLHQLAASAFAGKELLEVVEKLEPVYLRQPVHVQAPRRWLQMQVYAVQNMGRTRDALKLLKQMATDYLRDVNAHYQYAQTLASTGDYEAAYAWLRRALALDMKWLPHEIEALRNHYAQLLTNQGRYADLAAFLEEWVRQDPETQSAYTQYLGALVRIGNDAKADQLVQQWLKDGTRPAPLPPPIAARLEAAIGLMLGNYHFAHTGNLEEKWLKPLAEAALYFARHESHSHLAERIMSQSNFYQSDESKPVRQAVLSLLLGELDQLEPATISGFIGWLHVDDSPAKPEHWRRITDGLMRRWEAERDVHRKNELSECVTALPHLEPAERLAFLRKRLLNAAKEYRAQYVRAIFDHLLNQPWTAEIEAELFSLLPQTSDAEEPTQRLLALVELLHVLNDRLVQNRYHALMKAVPKQEELTRIELRKKQEENRKAARTGLADRLKQEAAKQPPELARWMRLERLYFETLLERDVRTVAAECWEVLGDKPIFGGEEELTATMVLDDIFRERHLSLISYLATRPGADAALIDRLFRYVDQGLAGEKEGNAWRLFKYRVLIALDRPKELELVLTQWIKASGGRESPEAGLASQWRLSLGFLLAEQGRIAEAIKLFEGVEKADELAPAAYRALADWYQVVNRRDEHEQAQRNIYRTMPEHQMSNALYYKLSPWQRGDGKLPSELDRDVLLIFAALFEKSGSPANYLYQLQQFYQASHDFRLLAVMVDGVLGHTPVRAYPFLIGMRGVLNEIRDEATVDEIAAQLENARAKAKSVTDQRALDLLELQVRRRAAELKNQPGPHAEAALAAMKRAFDREWVEGEPKLMADFLHGLGKLPQEPFAKEQLRQFEELFRKEKPGTPDRLHIGWRQGQVVHGYGQTAKAIELLEAARAEARGKVWLSPDEPLATLVSFHQALGHFARAEKLIRDELARPGHGEHQRWLTQQLLHNYHAALSAGGEVSLGKDAVLYKALETKLLAELGTQDNNHRYAMFQLLTKVYRTAHERKLEGVKKDVREFAFKKFPALLALQTNNYDAVVSEVAQLVRDILGPEEAITFVLDRVENEPRWLRLNHQDAWSRHGDALARWRSECSRPAEVEARLLKVVLAELRRDLTTRQSRSRTFYARGHQYYWAAKEADFLKVAEAVLAERKTLNAAVRHIADYLYYGLQQYDKAIAALFESHRAKILDAAGVDRLIVFLHEQKRFAESIPLLEPIVAARPESLQHRVWLMHAYFQTKERDKLLALLKETDAFFHQKERWTEEVLAQLGQSTLANELYPQCIAYYSELIPRYERARRNRGIGDGVLSGHYANKARAHAALQQMPEAVEAASAAIVSWGPHRDQRQHALNTLVQILTGAADLDAFVAYWDKKSAEDGKDSPIIRKALGQAFVNKKQHAKAIMQLRLAVDLQPNDTETHQLLVAAYDQQQDSEGAIRQLLASVELSRRDIKLFEDLGKRLQRLDRSAEAERAFTSIVEMLPSESESHTALAEIRQGQNRWPEAIQHWEHVARIRALEPTGPLKLAEAQIHEKQWEAARATVQKLRSRTWPPRFGDVTHQVRQLEKSIESRQKERQEENHENTK